MPEKIKTVSVHLIEPVSNHSQLLQLIATALDAEQAQDTNNQDPNKDTFEFLLVNTLFANLSDEKLINAVLACAGEEAGKIEVSIQ